MDAAASAMSFTVSPMVSHSSSGRHRPTLSLFFEQATCQRIPLVDDAADLGIDLLHGRLRTPFLVRGDLDQPRKTSPSFSPHHRAERIGRPTASPARRRDFVARAKSF